MDGTLTQGTVSSVGLDKPVRKRKLRPALLPNMQPQEDEEEVAADPNRLQSMAQQRPMLGSDPQMDPMKKRMKNGIQRPI